MDEISNTELVNPWEVQSITDLQWADAGNTVFTCKVVFKHMSGVQPFAATAADTEAHCRDIFQRGVAGEWGAIHPFVPPTPEQVRANMPTLQKWRVEAIIDLHNLRAPIDAAIDALPEPQRTTARSKRQYVTEFSRVDPLFSIIGQAVNKTPEEIDALWLEAATL